MLNCKIYLFLLFTLMTLFSCKRELVALSVPTAKSTPIKTAEKHFAINNTLTFSGRKWKVTNSPNKRKAPGNNYWSNQSVWVDENGFLHLVLTKDPESNKWYCAQISSDEKFGNGTYEFLIEGRVDQLDKNVVLGLFKYSGVDYYDEIDIEFAKWGDAKNKNLHYTVYPEENSKASIWGASTTFLLDDRYSIHRFTRTKTDIKFESYYDLQGRKIHTQLYSAPTLSKKEMPIYINLWAFNNLPPSDQMEVEIIIQKFTYSP